MPELIFQASVKGKSKQSELIPCIANNVNFKTSAVHVFVGKNEVNYINSECTVLGSCI